MTETCKSVSELNLADNQGSDSWLRTSLGCDVPGDDAAAADLDSQPAPAAEAPPDTADQEPDTPAARAHKVPCMKHAPIGFMSLWTRQQSTPHASSPWSSTL